MSRDTKATIRLEESYPFWYVKVYKNGSWSTVPVRWTSREAALRDLEVVKGALEKQGYTVHAWKEVNCIA